MIPTIYQSKRGREEGREDLSPRPSLKGRELSA